MVKLYVDSNAFISAFEGDGRVSLLLRTLFLSVPAGDRPRLVTSALAVGELLVKPIALARHELVAFYEAWTAGGPHLEIVDVSRDIIVRAAHLRAADTALKLPDAIHLATAEMSACTHFLSDDRRLRPQFSIAVIRLEAGDVEALMEASGVPSPDIEPDHAP